MDFDQAVAVKERHEDELLKDDSVQGVGVGEHSGRPAILVYVTHSASRVKPSIPNSIEGVPVVVEESGGFKAF
ncbi:MAG: hypothetical protein ACRDPE_00275 [Solirubrobacterales bacterium]